MAILRPHPRRGRALGLAALLCLAGCMIADRARGPRELAFSHRLHVLDQELDCVTCHEDAAVSEAPGMPPRDVCLLCHEDLDEDKPPERRVANLFDGEVYRASRAGALADETVFSHLGHAGYVEDCGSCHAAVAGGERVGDGTGVSMDDCTDCHARRDAPNECATCHTEVGVEWQPEHHAHRWIRFHGQVARGPSDQVADRCDLCHRESTCVACHRITPPESHTSYFRLRGHGLTARMDRGSCAACHESQSCDRCHREALPLSHHGAWGGVRSTHCFGCHFPLKGEGCFTCHRSTPSHLSATAMPTWHTPAMNCRQCHGLSQPLPHVDNGDECILCHR